MAMAPAMGSWLGLPVTHSVGALDLSSDSEELGRQGAVAVPCGSAASSSSSQPAAAAEGGLLAAVQRAPVAMKRRRRVAESDSDFEMPPRQASRTASSSSAPPPLRPVTNAAGAAAAAGSAAPAAAAAAAASSSAAALAPLIAMGFPADAAAAALALHRGNVALAADALLDGTVVVGGVAAAGSDAASPSSALGGGSEAMNESAVSEAEGEEDDEDYREPPWRRQAEGPNDGFVEEPDDPSGLDQLVLMGFDRAAAQRALTSAKGDVAAAAEALLVPVTEGRPRRGAATVAPAGAAAAAALTPRPGRGPPREAPAAAAAVEGRGAGALATISGRAKAAVIEALVGPESHRTGRVETSIRRGRVALRKNLWEGDANDEELSGLSPSYGKLKGYQRVGVRWLLALASRGIGGILADEMGLGKTAETLVFLDILQARQIKEGRGEALRPSLVVVPASLMGNWMAEVRLWCPHFKVFQYYSGLQNERGNLAEQYVQEHVQNDNFCQLILTTPGVLQNKTDRSIFFRRLDIEYLIYDEAHGVKNAEAQKFRDIYRGLQVQRRLLLTGTPLQNSLRELGNLLTLLLAQTPPPEGTRKPPGYRESVAAIDELKDLVERGLLRTLQVRAAPFILRRLKKDVMKDLPPKTGHTVHCPLTQAQQAEYEREIMKARAECAKGKVRRDFVKNCFFRLRRICNHPLLGQCKFSDADYEALVAALKTVRPDFMRAAHAKALAEVRSWSDYEVAAVVREHGLALRLGQHFSASRHELLEGSAKVARMVQLLQEQRSLGRKTLVFSQFTQFLDLIAEILQTVGVGFARLDGSTIVADRPDIVRVFQDPGSGMDVFLLSTKAGGVGLNLTAADAVIMMDLSFNPQDNRQAEDRVHRLGQTQPVRVHYFVCKDTIEEQILKTNLDKMALDYKFGGQKMLLQGRDEPGSGAPAPGGVAAAGAEDEDEDEEEEQDEDPGALQKLAKLAEQSAYAALERACAGVS